MKEMLVYRYEDVIHAPIDLVFKYVDDDEKIKLWNTMLIENIYNNEENKPVPEPGTKFVTVQKLDKKIIKIDSELIEYEAPHKVVMHSHSKEGLSISKYYLTREHNGTRLIVEASLVPSNFFYRLTTKLLGWTAKFVFEEQYQNLKRYVENEADDDE
ncbi:SRPBCC domain-containing protein [Cytobacillus oceanisediminis]|uniref:SRPBCC domain-containing protein n=1 Tax=Cytobacillus oceanisediminis TaxID=665099 RepID=UPI0023DCC4EF|nr:SRPBCC domain-containing protein [Cytobacillus oceanisediminis]MDF2036927.1 SRPBCC domain-containing protein [Cytobacillus oceanisediminis]